jgi:rSAM/selenodomain-associated transferase 1
MSDTALLVFAKAPVPGQAKTRLIPALGQAGAAELHARLVRHTLNHAVAAGAGPVTLYCTPDDQHPFFAECARNFGVKLQAQQGDNLGQRMEHALACSLQAFRHVLLIGTDCPALGSAALRDAAHQLNKHAPIVFVPTQDGGYALVGVRDMVPPIFDGIAWGGAAVMAQTRARLQAQSMRWQELPFHADVDTPRDLSRLKQTHPALLEGIVEMEAVP